MKNKNKLSLILFLICFIAGLFVFTKIIFASTAEVIINEIMYNPEGTDELSEWIELFNTSDLEIDLSNWDLDPDSGNYLDLSGKTIPANSFLLISNLNKMRNDRGQISLYNSKTHTAATMIDYVQYGKTDLGSENKIRDRAIEAHLWNTNAYIKNVTEGKSLELLQDGKDNNLISDWQESYIFGGTPGITNSLPLKPKEYSNAVFLNEILPYPTSGNEEFIELYNPSTEDADLSDWILRDGSKTGKYIFPINTRILSQAYLTIYKKDFKFALNNSGSESLTLSNPEEKIISTVTYSGAKKSLSYNFDGSSWRWSKVLTPGTANIFNNLPTSKIEVPKKIYRNTYANFLAAGADTDNDKLKYTWDFGDGHKSYLQETRHKYVKTGNYIVILKIFDGSEEDLKTFNIEVEKFPALNVNIIGLSPNPAGVDTDSEYILLKNFTKKKVNLNGWSIATATKKKFTNHPITLDLILAPKQEFKLTHLYSKFSLNNTAAKIELRYPNGKVASKVNYKNPEKSIPEEALYKKISGSWAWEFPITIPKNHTSETSTPDSNELSIPHTPAKTIEQSIQGLETEKNLGKFSPAPEIENRKKTAFSLLNFGLHINTTSAFYETTQLPNIDYLKTKDLTARKHWIVELRDTLFSKTNLFLNNFFIHKGALN